MKREWKFSLSLLGRARLDNTPASSTSTLQKESCWCNIIGIDGPYFKFHVQTFIEFGVFRGHFSLYACTSGSTVCSRGQQGQHAARGFRARFSPALLCAAVRHRPRVSAGGVLPVQDHF